MTTDEDPPPDVLEERLGRHFSDLIRDARSKDVRDRLAATETWVAGLIDRNALTLTSMISALQTALLFRRPAFARRAADGFRRLMGSDNEVARQVEVYLAAEEPSEEDMIRALYYLKSPFYDQLYHNTHQSLATAFEVLAGRLRVRGLERILDLACGTGLSGRLLRHHGFTGELVGVDLSPEMLEHARATGCYQTLVCREMTHYLAGDVRDYDLILTLQVVVMLDPPGLDALLSQARLRLRPRGALVVNDHDLAELADSAATAASLFRIRRPTLEAALKQHGYVFRAFDHDDHQRYYLCVPR